MHKDCKHLTDTQQAMARRVTDTLREDIKRFVPGACNVFFELLIEHEDPRPALHAIVLGFVCSEIDKGKLILVRRDAERRTGTDV